MGHRLAGIRPSSFGAKRHRHLKALGCALMVVGLLMPNTVRPASAEDSDAKNAPPATAPKGHPLVVAAATHARWQSGDVAVTVAIGTQNTVQWLQSDGSTNKSIVISPNT